MIFSVSIQEANDRSSAWSTDISATTNYFSPFPRGPPRLGIYWGGFSRKPRLYFKYSQLGHIQCDCPITSILGQSIRQTLIQHPFIRPPQLGFKPHFLPLPAPSAQRIKPNPPQGQYHHQGYVGEDSEVLYRGGQSGSSGSNRKLRFGLFGFGLAIMVPKTELK